MFPSELSFQNIKIKSMATRSTRRSLRRKIFKLKASKPIFRKLRSEKQASF